MSNRHVDQNAPVDSQRREALKRLGQGCLGLRLGLGLWLGLGPGAAYAVTQVQDRNPTRPHSTPRPMRVITLFQGATDTAVALGISPLAVVESWREKPVYPYLRSALPDVTVIGLETQPSLEDIALLEPDLIIASRFRHQNIAPLLQQLAPVLMLEQIYEFKETVRRMGQVCQREQQARWLLEQWQQRVSEIKQQMKQVFGDQPPTVSVLDIRSDHLRSYLPTSFSGSVLTELGFAWSEVSQQASGVSIKVTSKESLPVVNAQLFFVFLRAESPAVQQHYHALQQHPIWQRMEAPRKQRIREVDGIAWSLSGGILGANRILDDVAQMLQEAQSDPPEATLTGINTMGSATRDGIKV
ncbi:ABC transporter substrate-binding protein [Oceanospirillum sediminis]|uniref:Iron-siderophore ABC transporter substrate-binding protein n=1 Tax=Oceanospirillum sediminis TaxID=2760088 RepID=A0A839IWK0_9GAMM|nr:iron-siderophore ABC transporter substrate-binding protein [Oceanospirillum sediminis]MBB1489142.1 iron-siderophore ABC transporter substrate-binding protein [Oceanospirillum sediminis]